MNRLVASIAALALAPAALAQQNPQTPVDVPVGGAPAAAAPPAAPALAQPAPAPAAPAPSPYAAPAEKPAGPRVTPYGFVLLDAFWDSGPFVNKDNANQVKVTPAPGTAAYADPGGAFIASARGTRIGLRLDGLDSGILQAKLSGVVEFDFKGGQFGTNSAGWNAFVPRLRLAYARADWATDAGLIHVTAGQDWGLLLNVNPNTVTYGVDPAFVQSGNLYRRTPQVTVGWDSAPGAFGISVAAGVLSPADVDTQGQTGTSALDTGVGNKSRMPDVEGRVALSAKAGSAFSGTVGAGYHYGQKRYYYTATGPAGAHKDETATLLGLDADVSITPYLQLKGEYYDNKGAEDGYSGGFPGSFPSNPGANAALPANFELVTSHGWWGQATLKPIPQLWLAGGYGEAEATKSKLATSAGTRYANNQIHGALIVNASKALRFGIEAARTESKYVVEGAFKANQLSFSTQLVF